MKPLASDLYDASATKKATNVGVNRDLLRRARELGLNLSRVLERGLIEELRQARREQWLRENEQAIAHYNERVAESGVFSDGLRRF